MKNWIMGALATVRFELHRSFNIQRIVSMVLLSLVPPGILWLLLFGASRAPGNAADNVLAYVLFTIIFLVALVCLLSLLLWATPVVAGELEGKTWAFIAMRPGGRIANFLGKYLTSVIVSFAIAFIGLTLCTLIANYNGSLGTDAEAWRKWSRLCLIFLMASIAYSAVLSMIGTLFIKRAMVVGAGFLIGWETILSTLPAIVNRLTVSYHLRRLGELWLGWFLPDSKIEYEMIYGPPDPAWLHVGAVAIVTAATLLIGCYVVVNRQYISSEDG